MAIHNYKENQMEHFVYIYRGNDGKVVYVGKGKSSKRSASHVDGSDNKELNAFIAKKKYSIEIAGPFGDPEVATKIETAIISAASPIFNKAQGPSEYRFRPMGVPASLAKRLDELPLSKKELVKYAKDIGSPLLLVFVNDKPFLDKRLGFDPSKIPEDKKIIERTQAWWQLKNHVANWEADLSKCPGMLIGVSGSPARRLIIGSMQIDKNNISNEENFVKGGLMSFPIKKCDIDFKSLRGRIISQNSGIKFGSFRHQQFIILHPNGMLEGGVNAKKSK